MRPVRLQLKGFTSFKEPSEISFAALDRFVICGPTGAGKSSLLDALTFALFADAPRKGTGNIPNLISLGRKSFSIVLDFALGEQTFRVTRVRRRTGAGSDQLERVVASDKTEQVANGERAVTEKIEQLLGLNFGHFTQAVFLPQGKFAEFLKAKPADRRRLLNELLRLLIYEQMQERARKDRDQHADKKEQAERRLREDFDGVTAEALTELERQRDEHAQAFATADAALPALRIAWESARQGRAWTVEWEGKVSDRARHLAHRAAMDAARDELNAAQRAAGVVALLDQAEAARRDDQQRQDALRQAERARENRQAEHTVLALALARVTEAASVLPELRDRVTRLNVAEGRLALRDQLAQQVAENQTRLRELEGQRDALVADVERLADEIQNLEDHEHQALDGLASIGFDANNFRRLEQVRVSAALLQSERRQLGASQGQVNASEVALRVAEGQAEQAAQRAGRAEIAAADARARCETAADALRAGESAHAAAHLRSALRPGQDCPVCRRGVETLPADGSVPELDRLRQEVAATQTEAAAASLFASRAAVEYGAAGATAEAARQRAESARAGWLCCQQRVSEQETQLLGSVGDLLTGDVSVPVEERVLDAVHQASEREERHRQAESQLTFLRSRLALAQQTRDSHGRQTTQLANQVTALGRTIATDEDALRAVRADILAVAGTDEPGVEAQRVRQEIARLEAQLAEATRNEQEASARLQQAATRAGTCAEEAAATSARAFDTETRAANGLREAGFDDAVSARRAARVPQHIQALQSRIAEYDATTRAIEHRITELEACLGCVRVSAEECARAEAAHTDCVRRRTDAETQVALLGRQIQDVRERLELARRLRGELSEHERRHRIYDWLAQDLRSDRFQAYLLGETLTGLVADGSCHLARLTGNRYGLAFADDRIFVVDHDNAGERRGVDTLSGGETFLASLALALALSSQIQHITGAVHLDCLFIDEGFGTLDPEALRTVSDAVRGLQVGGRMVGIITHVPELKEEFDQRVIVQKQAGNSQVLLEVA